MWQFHEETKIAFAGTETTFQPNMLKVSATLQNWPFLSMTNSLGIVTHSNIEGEKEVQRVEKDVNSNGSLVWVKFITSGFSLYLFF